ncbi:HD domain-containing phosphohydrolase [Xanthobacter sp. KR7-65]|uniref:HD domain-containing phosphohydrolase n=1 Tax=Xanthobacter sp. KR7-65 TaxID=3156612 RepID=UPI0032B32933
MTVESQQRPVSVRAPVVSLSLLTAATVVASMALLAAVLMWQGWQAARTALLHSARETTLAMGRLIDEKVQRLLAPATVTLRYLARDPLVSQPDLVDPSQRLPVMADVLSAIPVLSAVYVGYPNGDFLLMRALRTPAARSTLDAPDGSAFLVQSIDRAGAGADRGAAWRFYDGDLKLLGERALPGYDFDARSRSWYRDALANSGVQLTAPYVFYTTRQTGVTLSARAVENDAVIGLDVDLSDLGGQLDGLKLTPGSELAIVGADGYAYAYTDLARTYRRIGNEIALTKLADLGVPALTALERSGAPLGDATGLDVNGQTWFGVAIPLKSFPGRDLRLLMAAPDSDLLAAIRSGIARQVWWTLGLVALLLFAGWFGGHRLGLSLAKLTAQAERLTRFDFGLPTQGRSPIREIRRLEEVLGEVCVTIENFLTTAQTIGSEPGLDRMLEKVLQQTVAATGCSRGAVYLMEAGGGALHRAAVATGGRAGAVEAAGGFPETLTPAAFGPGHAGIHGPAEGTGQLVLALTSRQQMPIGLLILEHPQDDSHRGDEFRAFAEKLSGALSSSIETRTLIEGQKKLLDSFILLLADAIDAKSPYTGGHCRRVPQLATMIVDRMAQETDGPYRDFRLREEERYAFHLGAWLHDCGKVTSPEHVIDKATKLEAIHNRIHEVRTRFEVLWRDAEIAHLKRVADGAELEASQARMAAERAELFDDFAFVAACNIGGEFMTDEAIARLKAVAGRTWQRHFDDRIGLSLDEERRLAGLPRDPLPVEEKLLADRPEHVAPWFGRRPPVEPGDPDNVFGFDMKLPAHQANLGEIYNLSIRRGTLSDEERFKINEHVVETYVMLKSLPWPAHLARVPEIAATHHERMDGAGYPRRLPGASLSIEERVMALADVFEALTAADRPYKPAKTLSQSLKIMAFMCREGHLDPEVFRYFLTSGLWDTYAEGFLKDEQRDDVDVAALLALLPDAQRAAPAA